MKPCLIIKIIIKFLNIKYLYYNIIKTENKNAEILSLCIYLFSYMRIIFGIVVIGNLSLNVYFYIFNLDKLFVLFSNEIHIIMIS